MPKANLPDALVGGLVTGLVSVATARPASSGPSGPTTRATPNGHATPDTAGSDFLVLDRPKRTTVGIVFARDGMGKSYFATNFCPPPLVVIGLDGRAEHVIYNASTLNRQVYYLDASTPFNVMEMTHQEAQAAGDASLKLITRNYEWAVAKSIKEWGRGTLVIDTSTELRDIVRMTVRGRVDRPAPQKGEGFLGAQMDAIINRTLKYFADRARNSNLNLILLSRSKPIYDGREDTGRITWDTDKVFSQAADWIVEYRRAAPGFAAMAGAGMGLLGMPGAVTAPVLGMMGAPAMPGAGMMIPGVAADPTYEIVATNPKLAHGEQGAVYRQSEWEAAGVTPFAFMCERLIPGSTADEWK